MDATENLRIAKSDRDTWLMGDCYNDVTGRWNFDTLLLDSCLGDERGEFAWGGSEFTEDAYNIRFNAHEGASDQPILRAELRDSAGRFHEKDKNLSERIKNVHGRFEYH
ncbi:hypothetical protein N7508_002095 [Penicillium antarcticum]|uniref:uncharacterized protein n=1 Tax=Penicillium antarcticum TaxID=416450 RepID=UPI0023980C84|nr:uncharacterized protein N7508_002095 [Penicillium antarcticum]KAJ5317587.1 hypothetical protein N7508_002095 [Penicillium antarcticum]